MRARLDLTLIGGGWGNPFADERKHGLTPEQYQRLETQLSGLEDFAGLLRQELQQDYADSGRVEQAATDMCRSICRLRKILKLAQEAT
jgi:hypothetical protein